MFPGKKTKARRRDSTSLLGCDSGAAQKPHPSSSHSSDRKQVRSLLVQALAADRRSVEALPPDHPRRKPTLASLPAAFAATYPREVLVSPAAAIEALEAAREGDIEAERVVAAVNAFWEAVADGHELCCVGCGELADDPAALAVRIAPTAMVAWRARCARNVWAVTNESTSVELRKRTGRPGSRPVEPLGGKGGQQQ
jgi:hypothetical protein